MDNRIFYSKMRHMITIFIQHIECGIIVIMFLNSSRMYIIYSIEKKVFDEEKINYFRYSIKLNFKI